MDLVQTRIVWIIGHSKKSSISTWTLILTLKSSGGAMGDVVENG